MFDLTITSNYVSSPVYQIGSLTRVWTYPAPTSDSSLCTEDDYKYYWIFGDDSIFSGNVNGEVEIYTDHVDESGFYRV